MAAVLEPAVDGAAEPPGNNPRRHRWVRWLLFAICLAIAVMWVYAFAFAPREGVYRVSNDAWRTQAREICQQAEVRRLALRDTSGGFIDDPTPEQMLRRADLVQQATDILATMLDDVVALPLERDRDRELVATFERYYRTILDDRGRYIASLRALDPQPYRESAVGGGPVSNVVTDFTSGNDLKDCAPPGELTT